MTTHLSYYTGEMPTTDELLGGGIENSLPKNGEALKTSQKEISQKVSQTLNNTEDTIDWGTINAALKGDCPW